jgi:hypothetical protein
VILTHRLADSYILTQAALIDANLFHIKSVYLLRIAKGRRQKAAEPKVAEPKVAEPKGKD